MIPLIFNPITKIEFNKQDFHTLYYFICLRSIRHFLLHPCFLLHFVSKNILSSCTYGTLLITNFQGEDILINSIIQLFPEALINPTNVEDLRQTHHIITVESQIMAIPFSSLSHKEISLLNIVSDQGDIIPITRNSHWQNFLEKKSSNMPIISGNLQILHINFRKLPENFDDELWFNTLKESSHQIIDWFTKNERRYSVVLRIKPNDEISIDQLLGVIQSLDADFDTVTQAIIGLVHQLSVNLPMRYEEELAIVEQSFQTELLGVLTQITPVLLKQIGKKALSDLPLLTPLKQVIMNNTEYSSLIETLFENQGNLSQTADKLFIHRNTLTYRLQKFYKETGMQLQYLPDLMICFLCLA